MRYCSLFLTPFRRVSCHLGSHCRPPGVGPDWTKLKYTENKDRSSSYSRCRSTETSWGGAVCVHLSRRPTSRRRRCRRPSCSGFARGGCRKNVHFMNHVITLRSLKTWPDSRLPRGWRTTYRLLLLVSWRTNGPRPDLRNVVNKVHSEWHWEVPFMIIIRTKKKKVYPFNSKSH